MVLAIGVLVLRLLVFWVPVYGGTGFWGPGFGELIFEVLIFDVLVFRVLVFGNMVFGFLIFGVLVSEVLGPCFRLSVKISYLQIITSWIYLPSMFHLLFFCKWYNVNITHLFFKQLGSDLSPEKCSYFQGFWGSRLLNDCLVIWPSNLCLRGIQ